MQQARIPRASASVLNENPLGRGWEGEGRRCEIGASLEKFRRRSRRHLDYRFSPPLSHL